ncbi:MAG TPA: multicopper oxidase domain-containing protein [Burkholderiales bacterium]|jgi:FtsP/CotA-like multicopper oxidase with cupredoxin domain|nr:multicopper oxidase domain-containing protein [Burkholderiales bacterium]
MPPNESVPIIEHAIQLAIAAVFGHGAAAASTGGCVVAFPFTDPVVVGRFVYHCHAVDHEDEGMMGVIEVVA